MSATMTTTGIPDAVIQNHSYKSDKTVTEVETLGDELIGFLDRAANGTGGKVPNKDVDELWHTFILNSREYTRWCEERYGRYVHHNPCFGTGEGGDCDSMCD